VNSTLSRNNLVKRTGVVVKLLDEEFDLVAGRAACFGNRPEHGPTFLFEPTMHLLGRALAGVSMVHEVDVCLSRPDEVCCSGQSWLGSPTPSMAANSPYSLDMGLPVDDDVAAVEGQHASDGAPTAAMTINSFIGTLRKPLSRPILPTTPRLRCTKLSRSMDDDDWIPKRSTHLTTKSKFRAHRPEAQVRKVMMKHLGLEIETDEASFDEFQTAYVHPSRPSVRR
jgi:hypothetical protein